MAGNAAPTGSEEARCCGAVQEATTKSMERREKRRNKAQPWIVLKMPIGLTFGLVGYASYVYIGRFCVPMLKNHNGALSGGLRIGLPFVIVYSILLIMLMWSYALIVFTSPGKARDHAAPEPQPALPNNPVPNWWPSDGDIGGGPYEHIPENNQGHDPGAQTNATSTLQSVPPAHLSEKPEQTPEFNAGVTDTLPPVQSAQAHSGTIPPSANLNDPPTKMPMMFTRKPSTYPVLRREYRYCHRDGFVKPSRAHHCRACGTCVLKYDHHCPWIGQCVGARNHKFFVNFLQWAAIYCMWTFATLIAGVVQMSRDGDIDPQFIVGIALTGLFVVFTLTLLLTHIRLILLNQSTVESLNAQYMKEREKSVLARMFAWYQFSAKRQTRKQWDREWGDIDTEGNLWWLGSDRKNWEAVMGPSKWGWFLPLGRTPADGVNWEHNPRFDADGILRPRSQWPQELR